MKINGKENNKHQGKPRAVEGNKETSHRSWCGSIRIGRISTQEGAAKKMSDVKKEIKETVKGMADVAFDAVERLTFQGSAKREPKKE